jgi:hypothetical protein
VSETKSQHVLAVALLEVLDLDSVRIEYGPDGHYRFEAWTQPDPRHNGSAKVTSSEGANEETQRAESRLKIFFALGIKCPWDRLYIV